MRIPTPLRTLSAAAAFALFVGCSSGTAIAPTPASPQASSRILNGRVPAVLNEFGSLNINSQANRVVGHYSCPSTGPIVYVSDQIDSVINVFAGKFAGQAPCGQLTSGLNTPAGLYVEPITHDLYVANRMGLNVLVFHRNQTDPYNIYTDPKLELAIDITVAKDGTLIASNETNSNNEQGGSISTWLRGPNGGTFVGNFSFQAGGDGNFVTAQSGGKVFFENFNLNTGKATLWTLRCPLGSCGHQTQLSGVAVKTPTGLASDANDDLIVADGDQPGLVETFELPNPTPSTFPVTGEPIGVALSASDKHLFIVAFLRGGDGAEEYTYPGGVLVGTVKSFAPYGIAVDPGHVP